MTLIDADGYAPRIFPMRQNAASAEEHLRVSRMALQGLAEDRAGLVDVSLLQRLKALLERLWRRRLRGHGGSGAENQEGDQRDATDRHGPEDEASRVPACLL